MATAQDLIVGALEMLGVSALGTTPEAAVLNRCLTVFNNMRESWNLEELSIYTVERNEYTLTVSTNPHTIGSGGTISATRPIEIEHAGLILSGETQEKPLDRRDGDWYAEVSNKVEDGKPHSFYYDKAYPSNARGNIFLVPRPDAAHKIVLYTWVQMDAALALGTTVVLPPGYRRALESNLAVEVAPFFGADALAPREIAKESKKIIRRFNTRVPRLEVDSALLGRRGMLSVLSGRYE